MPMNANRYMRTARLIRYSRKRWSQDAPVEAEIHVTATKTDGAKVDDRPTVHVRPAQLGAGGYGLAALGKF